jgi:hypothetical protein
VFTAVVRVSGAGRLADFRERLRWLMVRDPEAEAYTEHHAEGLLEYRFEPRRGIPFPAFAEASGEFPELRVEAEWDHDGKRGRAHIENGRVVQDEERAAGAPGVEVGMGEDGELLLALVHSGNASSSIGYAVTSTRQTFFRFDNGQLTLVDAGQADETLEEVAFRLVDEWIWFDEEEAAFERARYEGYGMPVRGANLRAEKLALLRRQDGGRWSTLDDEGERVRAALEDTWLKPKR